MTNAQPKALYYLMATQGFASFSFYVMLTLFVLYLTGERGYGDSEAFLIFGAYAAFAYLTNVGGGLLADRLLGFRRCIHIGLLLVSAGYFLLLSDSPWVIFIALGTAAVGGGFFGSNIAAMLGSFYVENDIRRDSGYTYFYMGINVGALAAMVSAGIVATQIDYKAAFAMSGVGALLALVSFLAGQRHYGDSGYIPAGSSLGREGPHRLGTVLALGGACLLAVGGIALLIRFNLVGGQILALCTVSLVGYFIYEMVKETKEVRLRLYAFLILVLFAVIFGAIYRQTNSSVVLYIARDVDLDVMGILVPPSDVGSLNPLFILILAPVFAIAWRRLAAVGRAVSSPAKFALALLFLGAGYLVLRLGGLVTGAEEEASLGWVVFFYLLHTMGELCLSPIGLAMAAALAPPRLAGFAMGLWMLSISSSDYVAGLISRWAEIPEGTGLSGSRQIYESAFFDYGWIAIVAGLVLACLVPILKRLMGDRAVGGQPT
ncbi:MAG: peptide MFS transporter [Pseudomonadota bacterium]